MTMEPSSARRMASARGVLLTTLSSDNNNGLLNDVLQKTEACIVLYRFLFQTKHNHRNPPINTFHWWWECLSSPSRNERTLACTLLLDHFRHANLYTQVRWMHLIWKYVQTIISQHNQVLLGEASALFRTLLDELPASEATALSHYYWTSYCQCLYQTKHPQAVLGLLPAHNHDDNEVSLSYLLGAWAQSPQLLQSLVHFGDPTSTTNDTTIQQDGSLPDEEDDDEEMDDAVLDAPPQLNDDEDDEEEQSEDEQQQAAGESQDDEEEEEQQQQNVEDDEEVESVESIEEVDEDHSSDESVHLHVMEDEVFDSADIVHEEEEGRDVQASLRPVLPQPKQQAVYVRAAMTVLSWRSLQIPETMRLLESVCNVVQPPKTPLNTRILMRRAPTQEEFFRGNLRRNPIPASILGNDEPTVFDLKLHIAKGLQMADSAELLEILVANKILDNSLKLRVVHQVLWRKHLMEGNGTTSVVHAGSALSIILSSSSDRRITEDTPISALPPMVATYRLTGVDGEATEDTVEELQDPECVDDADSDERLEAEFGLTKQVDFALLLETIQQVITDSVRRIRRDKVDGTDCARKEFQDSPPNPALLLLKYCSQLPINRLALLNVRAPTVLLRCLLDILEYIHEENNPTAALLQELIEAMTSDISSSSNYSHVAKQQDASNLQLLLQSIETIKLQPALRNVIAKLLPYLTYGNSELSRELAKHFDNHINMESSGSKLLETFVETAVSLPANEVCDCLRTELINCGFIDRLALFVVKGMPNEPPFWSTALWQNGETIERNKGWAKYYNRQGLSVSLQVLTGLCRKHPPSQARIAMHASFLRSCHWLEVTSDSPQNAISTNGLGLLAETLLDGLVDGNTETAKMVDKARHKTRMRKKELALQRRNKALMKMGKFATHNNGNDRGFAASLLAPVAGLFRTNNSSPSESAAVATASGKSKKVPDWLAEADNMKEEVGLTCAVCQEGRTLQPKELLGLYAFMKKVNISVDMGGARAAIDGTNLLKALPDALPENANTFAEDWFAIAKAAGAELIPPSSNSSARRMSAIYTTTVSAGTGIHINCHRRARQVDRNHPRAPKSEWEGALLRNNRVKCNVILPLVSSQSSKVPMVAVNSALSEHQAAVSTLTGNSPGSALWNVLHDVRLLVLRISYGESLSDDSGGGSLHSNSVLLYNQFLLAQTFERESQVDRPDVSTHVRGLSDGILAACSIARVDSAACTNVLRRGIADAAPMAALLCIVFKNTLGESMDKPHPKRQWLIGRDLMLQALIMCAGHRHARGMNGSGCQTRRSRSSSFADWDESVREEMQDTRQKKRKRGRHNGLTIEDFQNVLRPFITFFAIVDQISADFGSGMDDVQVEQAAQHLVKVIQDCQKSRGIKELLRIAKVSLPHTTLVELVENGMQIC